MSKITDFVIAEDEVYYRFFDGLYLLEPFREAKTRISTKNLIGNWIVSGFVSYDSTWIVNKEQYELYSQGYSAHKLPYAKEQYGDFEINDYMGKEIEISKQTITCEWFDETYDNITVEKEDRKDFERYRQVHDKLGITNDTIEVFYLLNDNEHTTDNLVDGKILVGVSKDEMIIHLGEGWFSLLRESS